MYGADISVDGASYLVMPMLFLRAFCILPLYVEIFKYFYVV